MGDFEVEDILGDQLYGEMPRVRAFRTSPRAAFGALPEDILTFTNDICVRIGSNARDDVALTVMVAGTQRRAGTSTLAAAIAARFAINGAQVLLLDADARHPQLSTLRFDAVVANSDSTDRSEHRDFLEKTGESALPRPGAMMGPIRSTPLPGIRIASIEGSYASASMRRQNAVDLRELASSMGEIVVIDGGPLLESAATLQLGRATAALVLAIPRRETARSLAAVAKELRDRSVLAVWTPSRRAIFGWSGGRTFGRVALPNGAVDQEHSDATSLENASTPSITKTGL